MGGFNGSADGCVTQFIHYLTTDNVIWLIIWKLKVERKVESRKQSYLICTYSSMCHLCHCVMDLFNLRLLRAGKSR